MNDLNTGLALLSGGIASKDLIVKVFGPVADYVGNEMRHLVERVNINLADVAKAAVKKGIEEVPGAVSLRVARRVINEGGVCDDALLKDYYGGLLTAAKSNEADDRAVPYFAVLEGLSTDQVTAHFIIYARIHQSPTGIQSITYQEHRQRAFVILPITKLMSRLGRDGDHQPVVTHVVTGLLRSGLIDPFYQYGTPEYIESKIPGLTVDEPVLVVVPSVLGVELFLWAAGERDKGPDYILNAEAKLMDRFPYSP